MSEIEKMYKLANVKAINIAEYGSTYIPKKIEIDGKPYPPFTAEKQIELIKWLAKKDYYTCDYCEIEPRKDGQEWLSYCHFKSWTSNTFEKALAGLINNLWQDLTEEEKTSIKNILEM